MGAFQNKLGELGLFPLAPTSLETIQINLGKLCNQECAHCHVDAGPRRKEIMTRDTMKACLKAISRSTAKVVDLTGGAPEMNPNFRWLVGEIRKLERRVMVRCNLTILVANRNYFDLPDFYARHGVHVVSSLPCYDQPNTDKQRGEGVFERSIRALQNLNGVGYAHEDTELQLDLVYNPVGAFLPPPQESLEKEYKAQLQSRFGIVFNRLYTITNMPIARFLDDLKKTGAYETYLEKLLQAFNPEAARGVMCRSMISIGWEGSLYDCDFNQMLNLPLESKVETLDWERLGRRNIQLGDHCFGCTAGAGSSCGGTLT